MTCGSSLRTFGLTMMLLSGLALGGCDGGTAGEGGVEGVANRGGREPVKVIAFDENEMVLEGIRNGSVVGTVVQNPYMYGYRSMEVLDALHKGQKDVIPDSRFIDIPARLVLRDAEPATFHGAEVVAVDAFWSDLKAKLGGSPAAPGGNGARFTFITNGVADFWTIGKAGAEQAARDLGVRVDTIMPSGITDQTRRIEDLMTRGTDGIAISPIAPDNQGQILNEAAAKTNLITHDSDAPDSNRLVYIGMDNYQAGLLCGKLVREALPEGGKVMLFIGRLDQDNAKRRRQGCIDGIFGREPDPTRHDPVDQSLTSEDGKYVVLGTMTDNFDRAKAKANAEDALTRYPDIAAMVGLFEYNPPLIMEALDRAGRLGGN